MCQLLVVKEISKNHFKNVRTLCNETKIVNDINKDDKCPNERITTENCTNSVGIDNHSSNIVRKDDEINDISVDKKGLKFLRLKMFNKSSKMICSHKNYNLSFNSFKFKEHRDVLKFFKR